MSNISENDIPERAVAHARAIVDNTCRQDLGDDVGRIIASNLGQSVIDRQLSLCWAQVATDYILFREKNSDEQALVYLDVLQGCVGMYLAVECMPIVPTVKRGFFRRVKAYEAPVDMVAYFNSEMDSLNIFLHAQLSEGNGLFDSIGNTLSAWWMKTYRLSALAITGQSLAYGVVLAKEWKLCLDNGGPVDDEDMS